MEPTPSCSAQLRRASAKARIAIPRTPLLRQRLTGGTPSTLGQDQRIAGRDHEPAPLGTAHDPLREAGIPAKVLAEVLDPVLARRLGPPLVIREMDREPRVVELANRTEYGLAAYFYSRDIGRIWRVAEALEYGMVGVNTGLMVTEVAPFGGVKQSGIGREGSKYGIDEFVEVKYICMGGIDK